ncbi:DUF4231 domain-containing protein [Actinomadura luteofluorescens]
MTEDYLSYEGVSDEEQGRESSETNSDDVALANYRGVVRKYEQTSDRLRVLKGTQRAYWVMITATGILAIILAYSVVVGLWRRDPLMTRYIGLLAVVIVCATFGFLAWRNRPTLTDLDLEARNLLHDKQIAVSKIALESVPSLKIYREASLDLLDYYRRRASRNRTVHNLFQGIIIIGSILASTSSALEGVGSPPSIAAMALSTFVSISAGITAYFKFRERGHNLQMTADEIEKHYRASEFGLDEYKELSDERERLRMFAQLVERIKEEQRKRELQLEQSPSGKEDRG